MAKKIIKVSITALDKIAKEITEKQTVENWNGIDITVKNRISFADVVAFVENVAANCFIENGDYMPEALKFATDSNIIKYYTNINLPNNLEHRYELVNLPGLMETIIGCISVEQYDEIIDAVDRKIEYMCNMNVSAVLNQIKSVVDAFEELQKVSGEMFSGITPEDMNKVVNALSNTDSATMEQNIVHAYMDEVANREVAADEAADIGVTK